jgi:7-cyano-7-deazaguanine synthase
MTYSKKAVILLSGGLDSATVLALAKEQGFNCYALSFDYGQKHKQELESARNVAQALGCAQHRIAKIDLGVFGGSALTSDEFSVPKIAAAETEIPITYVPARNTIFLSFALAWAEVLAAHSIFIGVNAVDYSGYPDCRPEFISAFEKMANLATKISVEGAPLRIHTPLISWSKAEIIKAGIARAVPYNLTHSCYDPIGNFACGACDACRLRLQGFQQAGIKDPIKYVKI